MTTALGGSSAGAVVMTVKNVHASTPILRGSIVSLASTWDVTKIGADQIFVQVVPNVAGEGNKPFGVAKSLILPGQTGTVIQVGACEVRCDSSVAANEALMEAAADPTIFADWVTDDPVPTKWGQAMEAARAGLPGVDYGAGTAPPYFAYALVNFLHEAGVWGAS